MNAMWKSLDINNCGDYYCFLYNSGRDGYLA